MCLADVLEAAKSHEVAVKPFVEGFANGARELQLIVYLTFLHSGGRFFLKKEGDRKITKR